MKRLQNETNMLKKELEIEKEKLHTLEAAFDSMKGQGKGHYHLRGRYCVLTRNSEHREKIELFLC